MLLSALLRRRQVRRRVYAEDTGAGFRWIEHAGEHTVDDAQVLTFALVHKENYSSGLLTTVTRRFLVWVLEDDETRRLEMVHKLKPGEADPLTGLIGRVRDRLVAQARRDRAEGRPVLGEGWSLGTGELTVRAKGQPEVACPVAEVAAAEIVDGHLCVWRRGVDTAVARVPIDSANAYLLERLLGEEIAKRPAEEGPPAEGQLGRILFERKKINLSAVTLRLIALGIFLCGLVLFFADQGHAVELFVALGLILTSLGVGLGVCAPFLCRQVFRCHAYGVFHKTLFRETTLRYTEVKTFTYSAVRHFHNGAYVGTHFKLEFEPFEGSGKQRVRYQVQLNKSDNELDNLRDQVSRMIAGRMARSFNVGEVVVWTDTLRFLPDRGIEYTPSGWLGKKEPILVPFAAIRSYTLDKGWFHLWAGDAAKSTIQQEVSRPNFFPGYYLLLTLPRAPAASG